MTGKNYGGFKDLIVWKESKELMILTYKLTNDFPRNEEFGLTIQMRKCSVSIMSQIAEGWVRKSKKHKLHYLEIAEDSLLELENQGEAALAVNYWNKKQYNLFNAQRAKVSYLLFRYKSKIV